MSLANEVAQKLLDIFADMVADGELGTITTSRDYTPRDQMLEGGLIQGFAPVIDTAEGSFGQRLSTFTFNLEYTRTDSTRENQGDVVERYGSALRQDPTLGGLVQQSGVVSRAGDVVNANEESIRTALTVFATIDDGDINQTGGAAIRRSKRDLLPVSGRGADVLGFANAFGEDSTLMTDGISLSTSAPQNFPNWYLEEGGFPDVFPLDVTGSGLRVWRFLVYVRPGGIAAALTFRFGSVAGAVNTDSVSYGSRLVSFGWGEVLINLDDTPDQANGTFDPTQLRSVSISMFAFNAEFDDDFILKRVFQYPRDRGTSGITPGF